VFGIGEVNMVQVLDEVIAPVEGPLRLGLAPTLLIFVASHMGVIGTGLTTERTRLK
jgi:hypothetical protein